MSVKKFIIKKVEEEINLNGDFKILDMGCGQAKNFIDLLEKYPNINYVGVEPSKSEFEKAKDFLKHLSNVKIINKTAYEIEFDQEFDMCVSLSVLEHVKHKDVFLEKKIRALKSGGSFVCFYDLGHYLSPCNTKEKFQLFLSKHFFKLIPESKFVQDVNKNFVYEILEKLGIEIEKTTYHNSFNSKDLFKVLNKNLLNDNSTEKEFDYYKWEYEVSELINKLNLNEQRKFFKSICFWGVKK